MIGGISMKSVRACLALLFSLLLAASLPAGAESSLPDPAENPAASLPSASAESPALPSQSTSVQDERIPPAYPVPDYVEHLLEVASGEVGYRENHGRSKYGEWAGDAAAQWCAEFQCWCVDQVDQRWGTHLLRTVYPFYTSSNTGRSWFIRAGRYVIRKGRVDGWGYEWLKGETSFLKSGDYIPQPGDWVFFTFSGGTDTDHVALVEFCTRNPVTDQVLVHVIEGNNPSSVARNTYDLNSSSILGYGTVHDVADITMSFGNQGEKVRQLQEKLSYLGWLSPDLVTGRYGEGTVNAIRAFQTWASLRENGIAGIDTQLALDSEYTRRWQSDPGLWTVTDED